MSLRRRFILALLLPAATTVLVAVVAYWGLNASINASEAVRELSASQAVYRELLTALIDAETGSVSPSSGKTLKPTAADAGQCEPPRARVAGVSR